MAKGPLKIINVRTAPMAKCFSITGFKLWNGLRIALRSCRNIFTLKNAQDILGRYKRIFYSETCIYIFTVLAFGIFLH